MLNVVITGKILIGKMQFDAAGKNLTEMPFAFFCASIERKSTGNNKASARE